MHLVEEDEVEVVPKYSPNPDMGCPATRFRPGGFASSFSRLTDVLCLASPISSHHSHSLSSV